MRIRFVLLGMSVFAASSILISPVGAQPQSRTISLQIAPGEAAIGEAIDLTGQITSSDPACISGVVVLIEIDNADDIPTFSPLNITRSSSSGSFHEVVTLANGAGLRARVESTDACSEATSAPAFASVRINISLAAEPNVVPKGHRTTLTSVVSPRCRREFYGEDEAREAVELYVLRAGDFVKVASKIPEEDCTVAFRRRIRSTQVFQARFPALLSLHYSYRAGSSDLVPVSVRR